MLLRDPFKILAEQERTANMPIPMPRLIVYSGAPGTGKTTAMLDDIDEVIRRREDASVTSKTNFAVDNANQRNPKLGACTLYQRIWNGFIKCAADQGEIKLVDTPKRYGRPEYFTKEIERADSQAVQSYVRDSACRAPRAEREMFETLSSWDPTIEPMPAILEGPLPKQCGFLFSLLQFIKWAEVNFDESSNLALIGGHRGVLFIDEAQDLLPIEALAVAWYCVMLSLRIVAYGDPQQAMDQSCLVPKLWQEARQTIQICGEDGKRRVPLLIAELAVKVLPGLVPPAHEWADTTKQGRIQVLACTNSSKLRSTVGFNISESRYAVAACVKYIDSPTHYLSPESVPRSQWDEAHICATPFGVKGYGHRVVTAQRWKPKHVRAYLAGDLQTRRRLYVALTRSEETVIIHPDMLQMIEEGKNHVWT